MPPGCRRASSCSPRMPSSSSLRLPTSASRGMPSNWQAWPLAASTRPSRLKASRPCQGESRYWRRLWKARTTCPGWLTVNSRASIWQTARLSSDRLSFGPDSGPSRVMSSTPSSVPCGPAIGTEVQEKRLRRSR
ncbi:hypothetical protein D9M71_640950 [compost metagenome]